MRLDAALLFLCLLLGCDAGSRNGVLFDLSMSVAMDAASSDRAFDLATASDATITSDFAGGADGGRVCWLEYNDAPLTLSNGLQTNPSDPCCYWSDGKNNCDPGATCGPEAGSGCCIIYSTSSDSFPAGCCYYEHNLAPATQAGCAALLASGH